LSTDSIRIPHQAVLEFMAIVTRVRIGIEPLLTQAEARRETEELLDQFRIPDSNPAEVRTDLRGQRVQLPWFDAHLWALQSVTGWSSILPLLAKKLARDIDAALLEGKTQWKFHRNRIMVLTQAPYLKKEQSNRRNTQYSTGPRSANNKKIVSRNAKPKRRFPWGLAGLGLCSSRDVFVFGLVSRQIRPAAPPTSFAQEYESWRIFVQVAVILRLWARQIPTWICAERHGSSMLACRTGRRRAFWSKRNQRRRALRDVLLLCSSAPGRRMW